MNKKNIYVSPAVKVVEIETMSIMAASGTAYDEGLNTGGNGNINFNPETTDTNEGNGYNADDAF